MSSFSHKTHRHFNSIKVRLKHIIINISLVELFHFNSIKVRLKQQPVVSDLQGRSFQFHKGTIKTIHVTDTTYIKHKFQFHKGTIKTFLVLEVLLVVVYFNSIKVRLKHFIPQRLKYRPKFQFHKGTIKTCCTYYKG